MKNDYMPVVIRANYKGGYRIEVEFDNGIRKVIDFEKWLKGAIFEPLKNPDYFKNFFIDGWTIAWPNGADIAPETLYEAEDISTIKAQKQHPIKMS